MIVKRKGKWCVVSEKSYRSFGCYDTKAEAQKRLGQVEYFKGTHKKSMARARGKKKRHP